VPFCTEKESVEHLFSGCTTAKYIWSLIACAHGVSCRPCSIDQFWVWIKLSLPNSKPVYAMGLAALCWAMWCTRNAVCFEDKRIKSPTEIICMMCSFFYYWAGLQKPDKERQMKQGAERLKVMSLYIHKKVTEEDDQDDRQLIIHGAG